MDRVVFFTLKWIERNSAFSRERLDTISRKENCLFLQKASVLGHDYKVFKDYIRKF